MLGGSKKGEFKLEDFPNNIINTERLPGIERHNVEYDERADKNGFPRQKAVIWEGSSAV